MPYSNTLYAHTMRYMIPIHGSKLPTAYQHYWSQCLVRCTLTTYLMLCSPNLNIYAKMTHDVLYADKRHILSSTAVDSTSPPIVSPPPLHLF
jgi:hypothetical protein